MAPKSCSGGGWSEDDDVHYIYTVEDDKTVQIWPEKNVNDRCLGPTDLDCLVFFLTRTYVLRYSYSSTLDP